MANVSNDHERAEMSSKELMSAEQKYKTSNEQL
jgi:hypothetical protein